MSSDPFDSPDSMDPAPTPEAQGRPRPDRKRPEAFQGRYRLPHPDTGKPARWTRVTNFTKLVEDPYFIELWKQRNVAKGIALLIHNGELDPGHVASLDVKGNKAELQDMCDAATKAADMYRMADEGTALHTSTEIADYGDGSLENVPVAHRHKVALYLDALHLYGLTVIPDMIERVTVSIRYGVAGKFDRVYQQADSSHVIGDLKTGDSLDLSFPANAAQIQCYQDGINSHGIWNGEAYDRSITVRDDYGIVVHLPSTRNEVNVYRVDLSQGRRLNEVNASIREARRIKAKHVATVLPVPVPETSTDVYWESHLRAASSVEELWSVAGRARAFEGHWNGQLAEIARALAKRMEGAA